MREIKALSRTICSRTSRHVPDFEIKADNRRFHNLSVSLITDLEHEDSAKVIGISCRDALSVWVGFWACFFEKGVLSACLGFFDPPGCPYGEAWDRMVWEWRARVWAWGSYWATVWCVSS